MNERDLQSLQVTLTQALADGPPSGAARALGPLLAAVTAILSAEQDGPRPRGPMYGLASPYQLLSVAR